MPLGIFSKLPLLSPKNENLFFLKTYSKFFDPLSDIGLFSIMPAHYIAMLYFASVIIIGTFSLVFGFCGVFFGAPIGAFFNYDILTHIRNTIYSLWSLLYIDESNLDFFAKRLYAPSMVFAAITLGMKLLWYKTIKSDDPEFISALLDRYSYPNGLFINHMTKILKYERIEIRNPWSGTRALYSLDEIAYECGNMRNFRGIQIIRSNFLEPFLQTLYFFNTKAGRAPGLANGLHVDLIAKILKCLTIKDIKFPAKKIKIDKYPSDYNSFAVTQEMLLHCYPNTKAIMVAYQAYAARRQQSQYGTFSHRQDNSSQQNRPRTRTISLS